MLISWTCSQKTWTSHQRTSSVKSKKKTEIEDAREEAAIQCYKYGYDNEDIDDDDYTVLAEHFLAFKDTDISENDQWKNLLDEYFGDRDYE